MKFPIILIHIIGSIITVALFVFNLNLLQKSVFNAPYILLELPIIFIGYAIIRLFIFRDNAIENNKQLNDFGIEIQPHNGKLPRLTEVKR